MAGNVSAEGCLQRPRSDAGSIGPGDSNGSAAGASSTHKAGASSADSSAACINESDHHEGTRLDFTYRFSIDGQPAQTLRTVKTVGKRKAFGGATPVSVVVAPQTASGESLPVQAVENFIDLVKGMSVGYGGINPVVSLSFVPAIRTPVNMHPGQIATDAVTQTTVTRGPTGASAAVEDRLSRKILDEGRETLPTPMGALTTCKFTFTESVERGTVTTSVTNETWIAAQGAYRGQTVKARMHSDNGAPANRIDVTAMTYAPR